MALSVGNTGTPRQYPDSHNVLARFVFINNISSWATRATCACFICSTARIRTFGRGRKAAGTARDMMAGRVEAGRTKFPTCAVVILALAMTIQDYALVSLFPYVGTMVKGLLSLETTNEAGECGGSNGSNASLCLCAMVCVLLVSPSTVWFISTSRRHLPLLQARPSGVVRGENTRTGDEPRMQNKTSVTAAMPATPSKRSNKRAKSIFVSSCCAIWCSVIETTIDVPVARLLSCNLRRYLCRCAVLGSFTQTAVNRPGDSPRLRKNRENKKLTASFHQNNSAVLLLLLCFLGLPSIPLLTAEGLCFAYRRRSSCDRPAARSCIDRHELCTMICSNPPKRNAPSAMSLRLSRHA